MKPALNKYILYKMVSSKWFRNENSICLKYEFRPGLFQRYILLITARPAKPGLPISDCTLFFYRQRMLRKIYPSSEYRLLEKLKPLLNHRSGGRYAREIGDDAAIRKSAAGERLIFTADTLVEDVHFSFDYMSLAEVGFKAMAVNLSDCAAMGAVPDGALVQVVLPHRHSHMDADLLKLYRGLNAACRKWKFPVIGGNLSYGPQWVIDITLIGRLSKNIRPLERCGAKKNDILWVTGCPGESSAGLELLRHFGRRRLQAGFKHLVFRHIKPEPRISAGCALSASRAVHSAIDISDGISKECHTLSYENNLVIELDINERFCSAAMRKAARRLKRSNWQEWMLNGGEDYELLFAAAPSFDPRPLCRATGVKCRKLGKFTDKGVGVYIRNPDGTTNPVARGGWDHLKS
jgi:thiamine-monophosphate kinase